MSDGPLSEERECEGKRRRIEWFRLHRQTRRKEKEKKQRWKLEWMTKGKVGVKKHAWQKEGRQVIM